MRQGIIIKSSILSVKKKHLVKRSFKETYIYKNVISCLHPREGTKLYEYYRDLIDKAVSHLGVDDLWNIKFICVIVVLMLVIAVTKTNIYYKSQEIAEELNAVPAMLFTSESDQKESKKKEEERKKYERELFYKIKNCFDIKELKKNDAKALSDIAEYIYVNKLNPKDEPAEDVARRIYDKLKKYNEVQQVDVLGIIILGVFAFFAPEGYLYGKRMLVNYLLYNEYLQLEVATIMVGKLEPIKVEEILNVLSENSKYFKRYIDEIRFNYFNVKDGNVEAFNSVISRVKHKELRYLLKALQQGVESDLKLTIENLENQRRSNKEFRNIKEQNKLKQKDLLGISVILLMLLVLCVYIFAPFEKIVSDFSLF